VSLTEEVRQKAKEAGFVLIGIVKPDMLCDLPYGWVLAVTNLQPAEELLPNVKSVVLLGLQVQNRALNLTVSDPKWKGYGMHSPNEQFEDYQFYYEVLRNKAWQVVSLLVKKGFDAAFSFKLPLKTSAVKCGLGWQGKNTLLITPNFGPRVRLIAVLTNAVLDPDKPFAKNLCANCQKCVDACPTKALKPYKINIQRCLTYAAESPCTSDVPEDVRTLEKKLITKPVPNSYIECTTCIDACPIGKRE
jgi:epoxyqueuosine reductase